ncbi:MAG: glycoside hydrolase family 25 protein [Longibaculum muris]|uniref:GH25 family lysozyme M1 (1,4-beta-N-acetylmuramidase) n=1 Tax=Longibaculum muris TaxID=1796628 RepID=A0A4R3Z233_9FIRM|nr:glycoside hydrolase family 25 protein [Longibaculum muris]KXU49619.1 glycosyl hydrolase family 25 [Candidatus Stoquefichus sp. KLE1796]MBS5367866.1 glycoside hydrolase family 25 protein [Coprobacillus cateniformis]MCR1887390.1 glycoside hydrolase family 25 protein [Longibaculum muris]MED9812490.1 glycoside hydrolase family 25 protein [Longibaculum muris]TCV97924.1 GH25 family lysozyme M1 (1,4-beta-N-acetylmuramidase) [Longibaculum muris]
MVRDGIDVSQYQGEIDWERVKEHIDFAILRCGYGQDIPGQDDPTFKRNADECTRLGIPFGVYLYSYATDERAALSEARHVMRLVKDYKMEYPVYLDLEDPRIGRLTNEQIERNCRVWADELARNNYFPGFYASYYWWTSKLTGALFTRYTRWVARYAEELGAEGFDMWQYTDKGFVEGINAPVDRNYAFRDFPAEIRAGGYNNFERPEPNPEPPTMNYKVGDHVTFNHVYISSDSSIPLIPYMNHGTITRVVPNARNPYLIGNGLGWVNNDSITGTLTYLSNPTYRGDSLVDALTQIGVDASFASRREIARRNGIENYTGSARQNLELLRLLREGRLKQ